MLFSTPSILFINNHSISSYISIFLHISAPYKSLCVNDAVVTQTYVIIPIFHLNLNHLSTPLHIKMLSLPNQRILMFIWPNKKNLFIQYLWLSVLHCYSSSRFLFCILKQKYIEYNWRARPIATSVFSWVRNIHTWLTCPQSFRKNLPM